MTAELPQVLVVHNIPRTPTRRGDRSGLESEAGVLVEVQTLSHALKTLGVTHRVAALARLEDLPPVLAASGEPIVFNLVESFHRHPHEACYIPALCLAFGKGSSGSPTACLELTLDKVRTKAVLGGAGLPVPPGLVVHPGQTVSPDQLPSPPWIVKPVRSDASEGIHAASSVFAAPGPDLDRAVHNIHTRFDQPALIETLVGSREINVSLLQHGDRLDILPIAEIDFSAFEPSRPRVVDYAAKWDADSFEFQNTPRVIPARLGEQLADEIRRLARAAWDAVGCLDYARVDFRLTDEGRPVILEVNPNPDISPDAGFAAALAAANLSLAQFVHTVLSNAARRARIPLPHARPAQTAFGGCPPPRMDWTVADDRLDIHRLLEATGYFPPVEMSVALEVLDESIVKGPQGPYQSFTARVDGKVVGWVCFGPAPCTVGTFDLYWLAVDPALQGRGVGRFLMSHVEDAVVRSAGRLLVLETAGRPLYASTRQFYLRLGYTEVARVRDFYAPGDDRVIYSKPLAKS